jgi:hypothetical protein
MNRQENCPQIAPINADFLTISGAIGTSRPTCKI